MQERKFKLPPFLITTFPEYVLIHYTKVPSFVLKMDEKGTELIKQYHDDPNNKIPFLTEKAIDYYLKNTIQDSFERKPIHFNVELINQIEKENKSVEKVLESSYLIFAKIKEQTLGELRGIFSVSELSSLLHLIDERFDLSKLTTESLFLTIYKQKQFLKDVYFCEVDNLLPKIEELTFAQLFIFCSEMKNFHEQKEDLGNFLKRFGGRF